MPCKSKCACGGGAAAKATASKDTAPKAAASKAAAPKAAASKAAAPKAAKAKEEKVDPTTLKAHKALKEKFGSELEVKDLAELAHQAVNRVEELKKPSRTEERSADKLYLWFETNWAKISPVLDDLNLDEDEEEGVEDQ
jgi:hypothetical protein